MAPAVLPPAHAAAGEPGTLAFSFGGYGLSSPYDFADIRDVAMAPDGKIVVLDGRARDALRIFHPNGTLYAGVNFSSEPHSEATVYVAPNGSILVRSYPSVKTFDPNGVHVSTLDVSGMIMINGSYYYLRGHYLPFAPSGNIIVVHNGSLISVLYPNVTHAFSVGLVGGSISNIFNPRFVDVGPAGKFFVEHGSRLIDVYHPNGTHASTVNFSLPGDDRYYGGVDDNKIYNGLFEIGPSGEFIISYRDYWNDRAALYMFYPNGTSAGSIDEGRYERHDHYRFGTGLGTIVGHSGNFVEVLHGIDSDGVWPPPAEPRGPPPAEPRGPPPAEPPPAEPPPAEPRGPPPAEPPPAEPRGPGVLAFQFGSGNQWGVTAADLVFGPGGIVAVADGNGSAVKAFHPNGTFAFNLVSNSSASGGECFYPSSVDIGPSSEIVVADDNAGHLGCSYDGRVGVFHSNGTPAFGFAFGHAQTGHYSAPSDVAVGPSGEIVVADGFGSRIEVFHPNGTPAFGFASLQTEYPFWLRVDIGPSGEIATLANSSIQVFHPNGTADFVVDLCRVLSCPGHWHFDHGDIAIGHSGAIAVYDYPGVVVLHPNGALAFQFETERRSGPHRVAFGPCGVIAVSHAPLDDVDTGYVADTGIQVFHPPLPAPLLPGPAIDGGLMSFAFERHGSLDHEYAVGSARRCALASELGSYGLAPRELVGPYDMAVDGFNHVIAMYDRANYRIQVFHYDGAFACEFGSYGRGPGSFAGPIDLRFDAFGLYTYDHVTHRAQVFDVMPCMS